MATAKAPEEQCSYSYKDGKRCAAEIEGQGQFCFWHDPAANKESPDVKDRLQQWARNNRSLEGILLRYAQLEGIKLGGSKGLDLSNADLFRANLKKARLTNVSLRDANLVKVDLTRSRLSQVNIQDANLMGVQLRGAKLD
ncbi:MAG: pentapeptide repeat-containing protein, partial [Candidatus Latescibacterota bacterium]|nr:pentapeptide repeat-containing protein [Candidatus Latescibacterota bacterium]